MLREMLLLDGLCPGNMLLDHYVRWVRKDVHSMVADPGRRVSASCR